ncbi:MAG: hypothetical protein L6Q35_06285 [Phycisphaerales bacterium]|nr:hypothetical protein [Phycisphaerales bacterium]
MKMYRQLVLTCDPFSVQFWNPQPELAVAVSVTVELAGYTPAPWITPEFAGDADALIVHVGPPVVSSMNAQSPEMEWNIPPVPPTFRK